MAELKASNAARKLWSWRNSIAALGCLIFLNYPASSQNARWTQLITAARQAYEQGKFDQDLPAAQESLRVAEQTFGAESRQAAISINEVAMALKALDRLAESEPFFRRALAINQKLLGAENPEVATGLTNLGVLDLALGRLPEARDLLTRGLSIREKTLRPDDPSIANSAGNLAAVSLEQGRYPEAEQLERRALAIDEEALGPESAGVAIDLGILAEAVERQAKYTQAEPLYVRALSIHLKLFGNEHAQVAADLNNLGALFVDQGRYVQAEAAYRRALAIDEKASAGKGLAFASDLNNFAGLLTKQARFAEAEPLYARALDIDQRVLGPEHPSVARVLSNLAALYSRQGRFDQAEAAYRRALAIRVKTLGAGHPLVANALTGLAQLRRNQGQLAESVALYQQALGIDEKALGPEHPDVAGILNGLGSVYLDEVQVPTAAPLFRRALAIHEKTLGPAHPEVASDLNNLAGVYAAGGQAEDAAQAYQRVIAIDEKAFGATSFNMAAPLLGLALLRQRQTKFDEAEQLGKRALSILEATAGPDHPDTRGALASLAVTYYGSGRGDLAATYFDRELASLAKQVDSSLNYMTERQRLQFLGTAPGAFPLFFSFVTANRQRDPALAGKMYDAVLREKGLIASNSAALRAKILDSGDPQALSLFDQLTAKRGELAAVAESPVEDAARWRQAMAKLDGEASQIESALVKRSATLAEAKVAARIAWRDVQKGLKADEAAVEYVRFQIHDGAGWGHAFAYAALVLTPSAGPRLLLLGNAQKLEAEPLAAYRAEVGRSRGVSAAGKAAPATGNGTGAAYAAFWQPLEDSLGGAKRVYVAADGILNQVPMGLFTDAAGKLLIEKYDLRIVNSTKDLLQPRRNGAGKTAVVIGNPAFDLSEPAQREAVSKLNAGAAVHASAASVQTSPVQRGGERGGPLPPLPATQAEAQAVTLSLKNAGWQVALYTGNMALEEALAKVRSPRVVHLATHGFFLPNPTTAEQPAAGAPPRLLDPMLRSGLYFAGADRARAGARTPADLEDGVLTAYEATQLHLQGTELVVLSACETGLGQQANGEGVFGLRRGLQEAGAESVLMSMWPVPDQETQELMALFYQQWVGGLDSHESLRRAQLKERETVRQRYGRDLPYYWGAFVLVGP